MGLNANELRIGNYVNYMDSEKTLTVSYHEIRYAQINSDNNYNPILLTEEWLIKFGFEKKTYQHLTLYYYSLKVLSHGEIAFHPKDHGFNLDVGTVTGYQFGTTNIKFVHQLQNLYFALTGIELTQHKN